MGTVRRDTPQNYTGGREVITNKVPCGWCMDTIHQKCKHETAYYEKLWICPCECNKDWVPQDVGAYEIKRAPKKEEEEIPDDLQTVRITTDTGRDSDIEESRGELQLDTGEEQTTSEGSLGGPDGGDNGEAEEG